MRPETRVGALRYDAGEQRAPGRCRSNKTASSELACARRVVLATGIEGSGNWHVPSWISKRCRHDRYSHTR